MKTVKPIFTKKEAKLVLETLLDYYNVNFTDDNSPVTIIAGLISAICYLDQE